MSSYKILAESKRIEDVFAPRDDWEIKFYSSRWILA